MNVPKGIVHIIWILERRFGDNFYRHPLHDAIGLEDLVVVYVNCCYSYVMLNNYASSEIDGTNQAPKCSTLQRDNNRLIFCHLKHTHFILSSDTTFKLTSAMLLELFYDLWIIILLKIITALKIKLEIENIYSNNLFLLDWTDPY